MNFIRVSAVPAEPGFRRSIEKALERYGHFDAEKIRVEVENGNVILEGNVHSFWERDALQNAVLLCRGS